VTLDPDPDLREMDADLELSLPVLNSMTNICAEAVGLLTQETQCTLKLCSQISFLR
jgi:hypothetical protein